MTNLLEGVRAALREKQVAIYLGLSQSSLRKSRMDGVREIRLKHCAGSLPGLACIVSECRVVSITASEFA